jgi:hypothetical protein
VALAGYDELELTGHLEELLKAQEASGSPLRRYLRPGLDEAEVRDRLRAIGLQAPVELVELYGWHDGTDQEAWYADGHESPLDFMPYATFPALEAAIADYLDLKEIWQHTPLYGQYLAGSDPGFGYWRTEWFPVFESEHSRHAIECTTKPVAPIWHVYFEPSPPTAVRHKSLDELIEELTDLVRRKICYWQEQASNLRDNLGYDL